MATYPPRRLLGARPLPSDPRRDPRRSGFTQSGGGSPRKLRCSCTHFQGPAARHHHLLRIRASEHQWKRGAEEERIPRRLQRRRARSHNPGIMT
ncbi:uncharacterized protein LOC132694076 isoform X3 [Panthera onca]